MNVPWSATVGIVGLHLFFQIFPLRFEPFPIFLDHPLLGPQQILLLVVLRDQVFRVLPEATDVDHLDVEVEIATDDLCVASFVFFVRIQRTKLIIEKIN